MPRKVEGLAMRATGFVRQVRAKRFLTREPSLNMPRNPAPCLTLLILAESLGDQTPRNSYRCRPFCHPHHHLLAAEICAPRNLDPYITCAEPTSQAFLVLVRLVFTYPAL